MDFNCVICYGVVNGCDCEVKGFDWVVKEVEDNVMCFIYSKIW